MGKLAEIEKVLMETDEELKKYMENYWVYPKSDAYDKIHKILMEDG